MPGSAITERPINGVFAVASEYFFERPADLKKNYPELYSMLETIFKKSAPLHLPTK
ncbi:MAG: zinc-dependent peptidase [Saprospirales bacterium]|nr:zinc-dependent peptidase [Saprospirales bacterium]